MEIDVVEAPGLSLDLKEILRNWHISRFTQIQVLSLNAGIADGKSQVICSPTSSGKTLVGEIAILAALKRGRRCLYLVSHKALADQKYVDFDTRLGERASQPLASVGLSTGDRDEGDISPQVLVATYEKALALILSGQVDIHNSIVVADELQILGEHSRGPNIETLCAIFRREGVDQFVALTATVGNAQELADWLQCDLVGCLARDVELNQEIWYGGAAYSVRFGQEQGALCHEDATVPGNPLDAVRYLLALGRGPVLVFTESRLEASRYAEAYGQTCQRTVEGIAIAEQLEFFSEPTESSEQLQRNAQRRVAFHTADLTAQERQVIEAGFADSSFDVCFATSTLAAGVNFPFRSVVFPKLTYEFGDRQRQMLNRSDYRNMSGRAGRLGLHDDGFAILVPKNARENAHANYLILPDNDSIESKLVALSMRKAVLALVSSQVVSERDKLKEFFENTFYWHQISERNPNKLEDVTALAIRAIDWLVQEKLIEEDQSYLVPTPVGKAVALSGLLPTTAVQYIKVVLRNSTNLDSEFEKYIAGLLHWVCGCDEFRGEKPSRFLPYPTKGLTNSAGFLRASPLLKTLDSTDSQVNQCAHALALFCQGDPERHIKNQSNISSGQLHRLATEVAWVIDGLKRITSVPDLEQPQTLTNKLSMLARQVQWGTPPEALDILRVAQKEGVPGFGRQRAVALLRRGIQTFDQLLTSAKDVLSSLLGGDRRTDALLNAVSSCVGLKTDRYQRVHAEVAERLGLATEFSCCTDDLGTAYEDAIRAILEVERGWSVRVLDDGKQQNVPDLLIVLDDVSLLIECKTTTKNPPIIKKEEAFAIMQKAIDYDKSMHRSTLGKPGFDEHSKKKAQASDSISLVEHDIFMEGILRVLSKEVTPKDFLIWLSVPGVTEVERLAGAATHEILGRS